MNNDLMLYARGDLTPVRADRAVAGKAKQVFDEVRLTSLKAEGALALAGKIMEGVVELDKHRRALAGEDAVLNMMLTDIEVTAVARASRIQRELFDRWS